MGRLNELGTNKTGFSGKRDQETVDARENEQKMADNLEQE